ncbi:uncharacterized protein si:dkey-21c1.4 [Colossoma macropomum]|uniref:uncharacterized protein si:dkey-21c1.4 n=1 Tax=Colossoma macropomum TaxID=42526 RepID=UPI001863A7C6|nr:uncharacterized protein si:dkey-21c1.4 [Colossoma macropomum]
MSLEPCPYCGKPFKRLKSHLPHCKMSPGSETTKNNKAPEELLTTTPNDTTPKEKKKKVNGFDKRLNDSSFQSISKSLAKPKVSMTAEKVNMDELTVAKVLSAEQRNPATVNPKSKWLAKREQEMAKQAILLTQKGSKLISDSQQEKDNCLSETLQGQVKETPQTEGQNQKTLTGTKLTSLVTTKKFTATDLLHVTWTTGSQAERSMPNCKAKGNILEEIQNSPKALTKDHASTPTVKEQADFSFFQSKTCVWDHIKHGLYARRSGIVSLLPPTAETHEASISKCENTSVFVHKTHIENNQNAVTKASSAPLLASAQTSVQRPAEDMLTSELQSKTIMKRTPEMATGYDGTLFSPFRNSEMSSNEDLWTKCESSRSPPQSQGPGTEQRLGDVRLGELAAWLGTRTPKSPREAVTMLSRGWQWYYRKYIDVQKGGIGGITMLIAGYCVLSYIWSYPHLKKERWRRYH